MVVWLLVAIPAAAACMTFALPWNILRRGVLVASAVAHLALTASCFWRGPEPVLRGWLGMDAVSLLFLTVTSVLFLLISGYTVGYLSRETRHDADATRDDVPFVNFSEAVFTACLLFFLAAMTLVIVSQHWGLLWIAIEATTLASAPLIYFHRSPRSLEATWKYLVICSVGIAIALLGNFFLAVAAKSASTAPLHLAMTQLEHHAQDLHPLWLKGAFVLLLVGYGTKMGLAPLHTWLPDAHSEAPSMVSALLSGVLLNCAFLAVLRAHSLLVKAGLGDFSRDLLVLFGLLSMTVAAVFLIHQLDYKRLLAYSSVEHMGILVLGVGIGGVAGFGSLLHLVNHSLTKSLLFLVAGNVLACYRTKSTAGVRGLRASLPTSGVLWMAGALAIVGMPPFGIFLSEFTVLKGMLDAQRVVVAVWYLLALATIFVAVTAIVIPMVYAGRTEPQGPPPGPLDDCARATCASIREPLWSVLPPLLLCGAVLVLGLYVPPPLSDFLQRVAGMVGAQG